MRDKEIAIQTHTESLSHTQVPKIALPKYEAWGDLLQWNLQENVPGEFPYTAGIYPFKRTGEEGAAAVMVCPFSRFEGANAVSQYG